MSNKLVKDTYSVNDFCKKFENTTIQQVKNELIEKIMNPHYVPYEKKDAMCQQIIKVTYYKKNENEKNPTLHINSRQEYMFKCLYLVKEYTTLKIDFKQSLQQFNLLNETGVLDCIFKNIPENEMREFHMVLEMVESDTLRNEYETHAFISNQVERFGQLIGTLAKPNLDQLSKVIQNINKEDIQKIITQLS